MKGSYQIRLENRRLIYEFTIRRNITIIRGNSATGKTTMIEMLDAYEHNGEESGINVRSAKPCVVLTDARWQENLKAIHDSIVFIDEDYQFVRSTDFAAAIRGSDNYYVLITRDNLVNLPYSVDEIYGIRASGKYIGLKKTYNELYRIYQDVADVDETHDTQQDIPGRSVKGNEDHPLSRQIITEDSNAGFDFFHAAVRENVSCISSGGKSGIYKLIREHPENLHVVVADGAAFGSEMERIVQLAEAGYKIILYLPESFEWVILRSGIIHDRDLPGILQHPEDYADSRSFFSWEQFFTSVLIEKTSGTYQKYSKAALNPVYLHTREKSAILQVIPQRIQQFLSKE